MAKRHVLCHEMTIKNVNEKEKKTVHGEEKKAGNHVEHKAYNAAAAEWHRKCSLRTQTGT